MKCNIWCHNVIISHKESYDQWLAIQVVEKNHRRWPKRGTYMKFFMYTYILVEDNIQSWEGRHLTNPIIKSNGMGGGAYMCPWCLVYPLASDTNDVWYMTIHIFVVYAVLNYNCIPVVCGCETAVEKYYQTKQYCNMGELGIVGSYSSVVRLSTGGSSNDLSLIPRDFPVLFHSPFLQPVWSVNISLFS